MARPTLYSDVILTKTQDYIVNYEDHGDLIPSIAGLSVVLQVSRETIRLWGNDPEKTEFFGILGQLLAKQEKVLFNKGLSGDFNPTIAKLALGKHGYSDKQDNTLSAPDGGAVKVQNEWSILPVSCGKSTD